MSFGGGILPDMWAETRHRQLGGARLIFLVTESLGGRELRFRKVFVMGTGGAMTLSLIIGVVVGLLEE